jgi:hypothetical protein
VVHISGVGTGRGAGAALDAKAYAFAPGNGPYLVPECPVCYMGLNHSYRLPISESRRLADVSIFTTFYIKRIPRKVLFLTLFFK